MDTKSAMDIWNAMSKPPLTALKTIKGGRLSGKTDINPQWRYECLTRQFGLCGVGWRFEIVKLWSEPGDGSEVFCFAHVHLYVKVNGEWSEAIPGVGGNFLRHQESKGVHNNDDGYKMAITDAIGTAAKQIGVAAEIYAGRFDGSKYTNVEPEKPDPNERAKALPWLEAAAKRGMQELEKAWKMILNEEQRIACKNDLAALKKTAALQESCAGNGREPGAEW